MQPQIIGISRSPIKKSNADRLVQAVLESRGLASEFVKLSRIRVRHCISCIVSRDPCANLKVNDDVTPF
jgi:multimeric flavodoxin WrbA